MPRWHPSANLRARDSLVRAVRSLLDAPPRASPRSVSDEKLAQHDRGPLFTEDGRKHKDTERVGAVAPDTDPPEGEPLGDRHKT